MLDMSVAKGSEKLIVDDYEIEGSVVCQNNDGGNVELDMNTEKVSVVKKAAINDKSKGAMVGNYKNDDDEVEMIDRNDLGSGAREDIDKTNAGIDENGKRDELTKQKIDDEYKQSKKLGIIGFDYQKDCKVTPPKINGSTALSIINQLPKNTKTLDYLEKIMNDHEIDRKVREIVLDFCKYRIEFCINDYENIKAVKTMLTEDRERYGIPKDATPTMEKGEQWQMGPSVKTKPKRFYADSSFYIFSFWLYLCLRYIRARLNEVLQEIDNKPVEAQI